MQSIDVGTIEARRDLTLPLSICLMSQFSTKLCAEQIVKVCLNEGPHPSTIGDNYLNDDSFVQARVLLGISAQWSSLWTSCKEYTLTLTLFIYVIKEIVNQRNSPDPPATERLFLFYSLKIPPLWKLEVSLSVVNDEKCWSIKTWLYIIFLCYRNLGNFFTEPQIQVHREMLLTREDSCLQK